MPRGIDLFSESDKIDLASFGREFGAFERSAKRLELLPRYSVPSEGPDLERFRAGAEPRPELNQDWVEILDAASARAAKVYRIRALSSPPTTYEDFELAHAYPLNREHGEEIRTLRRVHLEANVGLDDALVDYWLFDDSRAFVMHYDARGGFLGITKASPLHSDALRSAFDALWHQARA